MILPGCLHVSWTCTELSGHWRLFVCFIFFFSIFLLVTCARLSWTHSALVHVKLYYRIVSYHWTLCDGIECPPKKSTIVDREGPVPPCRQGRVESLTEVQRYYYDVAYCNPKHCAAQHVLFAVWALCRTCNDSSTVLTVLYESTFICPQ